jgi:hypothetical protein
MNKPITSKQFVADLLKILEDVVKDYPEDEREEAKVAILNAFGASMSSMPMKMGNDA